MCEVFWDSYLPLVVLYDHAYGDEYLLFDIWLLTVHRIVFLSSFIYEKNTVTNLWSKILYHVQVFYRLLDDLLYILLYYVFI